MPDDSEIFERFERVHQAELREDSQFITLVSLASRLNYRLSDVERQLLTSLIVVRRHRFVGDPFDQATADSALSLVHQFAEKTDHPFWEYAIFLLVPYRGPERLLQGFTFRCFLQLLKAAKQLGYCFLSQGDAELIDDFALHKALQELRKDDDPLTVAQAWEQVQDFAHYPNHPFWRFVISSFLSLKSSEKTSPSDDSKGSPN